MSIPHFAALSQKRKLEFTQNPRNFTVQEKIDGSNFMFKNSDAFPWAMRKSKNGTVYKSPDEWGTDMWVTGFRAAHTAMSQFVENSESWTSPLKLYPENAMIEMELLFASSPNMIQYSKTKNILVIYSPVIDTAFGSYTSVALDDVPYTDDGVTILRKSALYEFDIQNVNNLNDLIDDVDNYSEIFSPDEIEAYVMKTYVKRMMSNFADVARCRIEGLVFRHQDDGWMFKMVDREWFTETNKKNYAIRNQIFRSPRGFKNSIMDQYKAECDKGTNVAVAATQALKALDVLWKDYSCTGFMDYICHKETEHVHQRNLDAFASVRAELNKASNEI